MLYEQRLAPAYKTRINTGPGIQIAPHATLHWSVPDRSTGITNSDVYLLRGWCPSVGEFKDLVSRVVLALALDGVHCVPSGPPLLRGQTAASNDARHRQIVDASRHLITSPGRSWDARSSIDRVERMSPAQRTALHYAHLAGVGADVHVGAMLVCAGLEALAGKSPKLLKLTTTDRRRMRTAITYGLPPTLSVDPARLVERVASTEVRGAKEHAIQALGLDRDRHLVERLFKYRNPAAHGAAEVRMEAPHYLGRMDDDVREGTRLLLRCTEAWSAP